MSAYWLDAIAERTLAMARQGEPLPTDHDGLTRRIRDAAHGYDANRFRALPMTEREADMGRFTIVAPCCGGRLSLMGQARAGWDNVGVIECGCCGGEIGLAVFVTLGPTKERSP